MIFGYLHRSNLRRGKIVTWLIIIFGLLLMAGAFYLVRPKPVGPVEQSPDESEAVQAVVKNFGMKLKNVSLLSPTASQDIETNYKDFLGPALLAQWKADPSKAIGRLTSSPWPDEIVVADIKQFGSGAYDVSGKIIDMTSVGIAGLRPVEIGVAKFGDRWLITGVTVLSSGENELWKGYSGGDGISFQYPEKLTAQYVFTQEWPPVVKVKSGTYSCAETPR